MNNKGFKVLTPPIANCVDVPLLNYPHRHSIYQHLCVYVCMSVCAQQSCLH